MVKYKFSDNLSKICEGLAHEKMSEVKFIPSNVKVSVNSVYFDKDGNMVVELEEHEENIANIMKQRYGDQYVK